MNIQFGNDKTEYGPGVQIDLTGDEVATAIDAYLAAHNIRVDGARTIYVNEGLCQSGSVYVDPSGQVIADGNRWDGQGFLKKNEPQN